MVLAAKICFRVNARFFIGIFHISFITGVFIRACDKVSEKLVLGHLAPGKVVCVLVGHKNDPQSALSSLI